MAGLSAESHDRVAEVLENAATRLKEEGGIFMGENLNRAESQAVWRELRQLAQGHRAGAEHLRAEKEN